MLLVTLWSSAPVLAQRVGIELVPDRTEVVPDGRSRVTITARVQAGNGPVADGTIVRFATTAGRLESDRVPTSGGVARVILVAGDQPASARVTANLEGSFTAVPSETVVVFTTDAEAAGGRAALKPWIRLVGREFVGYALNVGGSTKRLAGAFSRNGGSVLTAGDLTIAGDAIQVDLDRWQVRAAGNVIVYRGREARSAERLIWELGTSIGLAELAGGGVVRLTGRDLAMAPMAAPPVGSFEIVDQGVAESTVVCRQLDIEQGGLGRLQMRDATLFVGGQKLISVPYHTMLATQRTLFREQLFGLGPSGITLDLPFHFDVRPTGVGTLHLRRGARFGSSVYASRSGWALDLDQTFDTNGGRGSFQILNLTQPDRGMRLQHGQQFGGATDVSVFVDSPNSRDLFGTFQLGHVVGGMRFSGFASGTRSSWLSPSNGTRTSSGDIRTQWMVEGFARPVPGLPWIRYTLNASTQELRSFGSGSSSDPLRSHSAGSRFITRPFDLGDGLVLTQSVVLGRTWSPRVELAGGTMQGTTSVSKSLGTLGTLQANYDYISSPNRVTLSTVANPRHRLGLAADATLGSGVMLNVYGAQGLDVRQSSLSAGVSVPVGNSWEARVRRSDTTISQDAFRETEVALVRTVGGQAVGIYYSTIARRIQLDLTGGLRF